MAQLRKLEGIRVLLVEDHDDAREMYVLFLEYQGAVVRSTANAESALEIASEWHPDVIVTDFILRDGPNGAELCRRVHADPRFKGVPTLVVTGSTQKKDAEAILGAGCAGIRLKPYLPDALVQDVRLLAGRTQVRERSA